MARKDENITWKEKVQRWWETDTAKAVATIIAVLLIPASVIAWNYATSRNDEIRDQLEIGGTSTTTDNESNTDTDTTPNGTNQSEDPDQGTTTQEPVTPDANNEGTQNDQGQEPANGTTDNNAEQPVGGLGSVQTLPNTDSAEYYTVQKGDNVYRISMKVCGNDSYYRANLNSDYLKVGETIRVTCN